MLLIKRLHVVLRLQPDEAEWAQVTTQRGYQKCENLLVRQCGGGGGETSLMMCCVMPIAAFLCKARLRPVWTTQHSCHAMKFYVNYDSAP